MSFESGSDNGNELEMSRIRDSLSDPCKSPGKRHILITGGAGFIGTNLADRLLKTGHDVVVFDNLSRPGVERNVAWLRTRYPDNLVFVLGDMRDRNALRLVLEDASRVFHLAAQVAVTTSLMSPVLDFEINAIGTLNLLEELRRMADPPPLIFTSTNKVYGGLEELSLKAEATRYYPADPEVFQKGIDEQWRLHFHSPYGCSKGAADQYVMDYARVFSVPAVVFRMSCIYGPHQCGTEDQGWVAHFIIQALRDRPITLYGDGMQVRDILFVEDLLDAFLLAQAHMDRLSGQAFNIGGGPRNTVSLLELIEMLGRLQSRPLSVRREDWRPADQKYFVSDSRKFEALTGWKPMVGVDQGVRELFRWLHQTDRLSMEPEVRQQRVEL